MENATTASRPVLVSLTDTDVELLRMLYALLSDSEVAALYEDMFVLDLSSGLLDLLNRCDLAIYRQFGERKQ